MEQSRWRSPAAWSAVGALLFFMAKNWGLLDKIGLSLESFKELVSLVSSALIAFGVFNNPTNKNSF